MCIHQAMCIAVFCPAEGHADSGVISWQVEHGLDALGPVGICCTLEAIHDALRIEWKAVRDDRVQVYPPAGQPLQAERILQPLE